MEFSPKTEAAINAARRSLEVQKELLDAESGLAEEQREAYASLASIEERMEAGEDLLPEWRSARSKHRSIMSLLEANWRAQSRVRDEVNKSLGNIWTSIKSDHLPEM